jgi:LDH2 family malate/lactate/ureidoglycolate dehydrogenase
MIAVNIEAFGPKEAFKKRMDSMIQTIKGSELAPGFEEIMLPGEPEFRREQEHIKNGILLGEKLIDHLMALAKELRIPDDAIDAIFC